MRFIYFFPLIFFTTSISSQVAVRYEPRHKVALENQYVRLLDVRIPPGDTSLYHVHEIPSFFIPLSTTVIGSQVMGQPPRDSRFPLDSTWYNGFENGPLIHRVWNNDSNVLHVIDLELLSVKNSTLPATVQLPFRIDFENQKLRVYKFELASGQILSLPFLETPMLFIVLTGSDVDVKNVTDKNLIRVVKPGGFQWLDSQKKFQLSNRSGIEARSILILLK